MSEDNLPIKEHLVELRKRVTWSILVVIVSTGAAFAFHQQILSFLMEPAQGFADRLIVVDDEDRGFSRHVPFSRGRRAG